MKAKSRPLLAPSMMCADLLHLRETLDCFTQSGVDWLHIDVMDGHYVPNFALGPDFCRTLTEACEIRLDLHLMVEEPERHLPAFMNLGPANITFHPETTRHPLVAIQRIRDAGCTPGIAISPSIEPETIRPLLAEVPLVCVMTVNPGYAGQKLVPHTLGNISRLAEWRAAGAGDFLIEVDGNVSWTNIPTMLEAGADALVCGTSSLFDRKLPLDRNLERMLNLLESARSVEHKT